MREEHTQSRERSIVNLEHLPCLSFSSDPVHTPRVNTDNESNDSLSHQLGHTFDKTSRIAQMTERDAWPCSVMISSRKSNMGTKGSGTNSSQHSDKDWEYLSRGPFRPPPSASAPTRSALRTKRGFAIGPHQPGDTTLPKSSKVSGCRVSFVEPRGEQLAELIKA